MVNQFNPLSGLDIFEEGREGRNLIFQTFLDRFKKPRFVTDFNRPAFTANFGNQAQNEFLGATGTAVANQEAPPTFTEFLNNDFNLGRRARRAPTQQMGTGISRFASPARFLFNQ
tara:strand:+ start:568 stop:912 length:345 start_codon:yes stop_codon:yes gene_type:complete